MASAPAGLKCVMRRAHIPNGARSLPRDPQCLKRSEDRRYHCRTSSVLVTRTQVQPVSLQTRSSAAPGRTIVVVARDELALVDPQLAVEEMQLFHARMRMRWVARAGREAYQHADKVPFLIGREQLAFDPRCDLLPVRLGPLPRRRRHRLLARLLGDAKRKTALQRCRRTQHVGGPGDEPIDHRAEALQLALAIRARGDMGFGRRSLTRRQNLQGEGARRLALLAAVPVWTRPHAPKTTTASSWMGPNDGGDKRAPQPASGACDLDGPQSDYGTTRPRGFSEGYPSCW